MMQCKNAVIKNFLKWLRTVKAETVNEVVDIKPFHK